MKKLLLYFCVIILLVACERPATSTDWSPINDIATPRPTSSATYSVNNATPNNATATAPSESQEKTTPIAEATSTPLPTLDLSKFPNPLPEAMKGYELVSWQSGEDWNFTLITGTNRSKSFDELMAPESQVSADGFVKITVPGVEGIKQVLAMLPAKTEVFWSGMDLSGQVPDGTVYFAYPSKIVKDELISFCASHKVILEVLVDPGK